MPALVSYTPHPHASNRQPRTQQRVEGRLDLASAGHQNRLDNIGVDAGESLNQRVLRLHLGVHWSRWLLGRDLGCLFVEAHAGLGRLGAWRRRFGVLLRRDSRSVVVVVKVELTRRRWALGGLSIVSGGAPLYLLFGLPCQCWFSQTCWL